MGGVTMRRCPKCSFPNMDTDHTCFKCGQKLNDTTYPEEQFTESPTIEPPATPLPQPETASPTVQASKTPSQADHYATAYINSLLNDTHSNEDKLISTKPTIPLPEPDTAPPKPKIATRITPKYDNLRWLSIFIRIVGILQSLFFIILGILGFLSMKGLLGILALSGCILMALLSILMAFSFSIFLTWLNDVECNQRRQIELIHHLYHK